MDYDPESDLRALEAMAANLTPYLYEKELYGTLSANLPKLTVGGLLLRLYRLQGMEDHLNGKQQDRLHKAASDFEKARSEWTVHYEGKIKQEIGARLGNLGAFLDDQAEDGAKSRADYPTAATQRTMVYHLRQEAERLGIWTQDSTLQLWQTDKRLRTSGKPEGRQFIWSKDLEPLYPADNFWWLYG